uniref:Uncharacterized protein n=1 Tax=Clytia hemisphaerica TaxID=252671 RepID=A0A7M5UQ22_9CNID
MMRMKNEKNAFVIFYIICSVMGSLQKDIHISRDSTSQDVTGCGNISKPCQSIPYALQLCLDGDNILLDSRFKYVLNEAMCIQKALQMNIYRPDKKRVNHFTTIQFDGDLDSLVEIYDNVSFTDISFSHQNYNSKLKTIFDIHNRTMVLQTLFCQITVNSTNDLDEISTNYTLFKISTPHNPVIIFDNTYFIRNQAQQTSYHISAPLIAREELSTGIHFIACSFNNLHININSGEFMGKTLVSIKYTIFNRTQFEINGFNVEIYAAFSIKSALHINNNNLNNNKMTVFIWDSSFIGSYGLSSTHQFMLEIVSNYNRDSEVEIVNCIFKNGDSGCVYLNSVKALLTNSTFNNNTMMAGIYSMIREISAGVTSFAGKLNIVDCSFRGNSVSSNQVSSIYARPMEQFGFEMIKTEIYSEHWQNSIEDIPVIVVPLQFPSNITLQKMNITCQKGQNLEILESPRRSFDTYLKISCKSCRETRYNALDKSSILWDDTKNISKTHKVECFKCPYQAYCVGNGSIRSNGNYWGKSNLEGYVDFYLCPPNYCCPNLNKCHSFDTCQEGRKGRLCGDCLENHAISIFSQNRCVRFRQCDSQGLFILGYCISVLLICLFLLYNTDLWKFLKNLATRKKTRRENSQNEETTSTENEHPYLLLQDENTAILQQQQTSSSFSGIIKITFFFYQTASILRIVSSAKEAYHMPHFISIIISFFNIRIDIKSDASEFNICPLNTSNPIIIELIKSSLPLISQVALLLLLFAPFRTSFHRRLKGAYVNLLLLGYMSIAVFCFHTVNCIEIDGENYLYTRASVKCFQPMQKAILGIICLWIIPFPLVLYFGCRKLRVHKITPNEFLFMLTIPVSSVYYLVMRPCLCQSNYIDLKPENLDDAAHMLSILNEPFHENKDGFQLMWEPILIARRLVLAAVTTFIISQMTKLYVTSLLLVLFTIHDYIAKPFNQKKLNFTQITSMLVLILLAMVNLFWAYCNDSNLIGKDASFVLGKFLLAFEMVIMCFPFIFAIYILILKCFKYCHRKQE